MNIVLHRLNIQPSMACTLKCKLCNNLSPYYEKPPTYDISFLKKKIASIFMLVDSIDIVNISGGEPFLYEHLEELLDFLVQYRGRINIRLDILSNCTIVPEEKVIKAIKRADASVLCDDYGVNNSKKIREMTSLFRSENITFRYRNYTNENTYYDGWLYCYARNTEPINTNERVEMLHDECLLIKGEQRPNVLMDGKLYFCFCQYWLDIHKVECQEEAVYIIPDPENIDIEYEKSKLTEWLRFNSLNACKYCFGFLKDAPRYTPAEQLE